MLKTKNKYLPRFIAVLLAAAMVFGLAVTSFATDEIPVEESTAENTGENIPEEETEEPKVTSGICGANLSWSFEGGTLTINGSGEMTDYSLRANVPWYSFRNEIIRLVLPSGLTSVGENAFYECKKITAVTIPDSVKRIGDFAFAYCSGIKMLELGKGVQTIGESAFSDLYSLVSVNIPSSVRSIGMKGFYRCESITTVVVPSSVTELGLSAFAYNKSLVSATVNANIRELPEYIFFGCKKLSSVYIPKTVEEINDYCFNGCSQLSTVYYEGESDVAEEITDKIGGTVTEGKQEGPSSAGIELSNGENSFIESSTTVVESENASVSTTTEIKITVNEEKTEIYIDEEKTVITIIIYDQSGWEDAKKTIEEAADKNGYDRDGKEKHLDVYIYLYNGSSVDEDFIKFISGRDITVTVMTVDGSAWKIDGRSVDFDDEEKESFEYNLSYTVFAADSDICEELGSKNCFVLRFNAPAEINAEVMIGLGEAFSRGTATLFQRDKELKRLQSAVVDSEGYAHFYLASVTEKTEYFIAMNLPDAESEAIIPENMLAEYGTPDYIEPIKYEITGRTSSWGMNLGQVMGILAAVMVSVVIITGIIMFVLNKRRLKNGYVPDMGEEE